jgi:hypothetical protein
VRDAAYVNGLRFGRTERQYSEARVGTATIEDQGEVAHEHSSH